MSYIGQHKENLIAEFRAVWAAAGFKTRGTWEEVFGQGPKTDEIFMAWHFARYTNQVAQGGAAEYKLPMYVPLNGQRFDLSRLQTMTDKLLFDES